MYWKTHVKLKLLQSSHKERTAVMWGNTWKDRGWTNRKVCMNVYVCICVYVPFYTLNDLRQNFGTQFIILNHEICVCTILCVSCLDAWNWYFVPSLKKIWVLSFVYISILPIKEALLCSYHLLCTDTVYSQHGVRYRHKHTYRQKEVNKSWR